ncbi:DISARM system phospholipase D-like protein DrmC [Alkalispirochaeta alkalica]|uniref:DISARM system phospholipase D-like protein DrmC n=1 Tax=Alkalispirochaeta alkalica TaxID=46356 RepID=UPI0012FD907C|nr:DISARM system phospholipase D-like protein DrmC [Alkalispirochaeta alkalica]
MIEDILLLPPYLRARLSGALETGLLNPPLSLVSLRAAVGPVENDEAVLDALEELAQHGISGRGAAAWIRTVDRATATQNMPGMVWSGPSVPGLHARDTRQVFDEILGAAKQSLWISTYAFFDGPKAFEVLSRRMDAQPQLNTTILLNISRKKGDASPPWEVVSRFSERFWKYDWPGSVRPRIFYDPRSLDESGPGAVFHAKAVVADDEAVLVTSANLTEAAFDRNIELGLHLCDRALAKSITAHFRTLIEKELLLLLP